MKKLLALSWFLVFAMVAFSAVVKHEFIAFDHNSAYLSKDARHILGSIIPDEPGWMIEKIDIEGHCDPSWRNTYNLELSKARAVMVYEFLSDIFPDKGDYEIRHVGENHPFSIEDPAANRCVLVSIYLLEIDVKATPTQVLFPEEFPGFIDLVQPPIEDKTEPAPVSKFIPTEFEADTKFKIEDIFFYGNSAVYRDESKTSLHELAAFMKYNTAVRVRIDGHVNGNMGKRYLKKAADSNPERTTYKNAIHLSYERANTVKRFLVNEGIDGDRIQCEGKGGSEKIHEKPKNQAENRANRRIEVIILNK